MIRSSNGSVTASAAAPVLVLAPARASHEQDIKVEGLDVMKQLMERRKEELAEEEAAAEAKLNADREVRFHTI